MAYDGIRRQVLPLRSRCAPPGAADDRRPQGAFEGASDADSESRASYAALDVTGAVTAAGAMLLAAYTVIRLEHGLHGWPLTTAAALAALLLATVFVAVERRTRTPLVRLGILRKGSVVRADLGALLFVGAFFGFQFVVTLYLQELRDWSAL